MIKRINKIENFGSFKNFSWQATLDEFLRFNLFYGWNGSGKTTLSKLFLLLQSKNDNFIKDDRGNLLDGYNDYKFQFLLDNGSSVTNNDFQSNALNIQVFNEVFIKNNIDWDNVVNKLLLISQEKISEKEELEENKKETKSIDKEIDNLQQKINDSNKIKDAFFQKTAKSIKEKFKVIDTSDKYYFNYDKRKLSNFIDSNYERVIDKTSILSELEVSKLTTSIKPNILEEIFLPNLEVKVDFLNKIRNQVLDVLQTSLIVQEIQRLKDNPNIANWVEKGIKLHKNSDVCEFCGNKLSKERLNELEQHFSDKFILLKDRIKKAIDWLPTQKISFENFDDNIEVYDEFKEIFKNTKKELLKELENINDIFDVWLKLLKEKDHNPFKVISSISEIDENILNTYNDKLSKFENIIKQHNEKTKNFNEVTKKLKEKLELHYTSLEYQNQKIKKLASNIENQKIEIKDLNKKNSDLKANIEKLNALLSDEAFGAQEFNKKLHKFIGRNDISLNFNSSKNGYEILRRNKKAINLSEGEKTAIAFIYFITKLKENSNNIEDSIIVVDDPISSFDSNHLFSAYAFLKNECEKAKQLFVLTHNFSYFKLIRDWFNPIKDRTSIYTIEAQNISDFRTSNILKAKESLTKYQSEYQYIFSKLYQYKDNGTIEIEDAYLIGNLSRKLLEAFFSFKLPRKRSDFRTLMDAGISDKELLEKVYKFINKYSHNQNIEFYDSSDDNILAESANIVNDILENIIKEADENHYNEMVALIQN